MISRRRMFQRIMTIIGIIIIIILSFLVILLRTDLLKSNQDIFYKYISKNLELKEVIGSSELTEYLNRNKKENYVSSGTIKIKNTNNSLNNMEILTEEKAIPETKKKSFNIVGMYNNSELFGVKYLRNEDTFGLKSDEVIDKFLTIKNDNLKEFVKKWGVQDTSAIPDKIEFKNEQVELSDEEKDEIKKRYMKIIKENISKKKFRKQKNVDIEVNGQNIKSAEYSLTLSLSEIRNLEKNILEVAKNDQNIIDIYSKMKDDINSEKQYKEVIEERLEYINNDTIENSENQNFIIKVYVNKGKLIKTSISQNIKELSLSIVSDNKVELTYINDISKKEDKYKIEIEKTIQKDDILYKIKLENKSTNIEFDFNIKGDINLNKIQEYYGVNIKNDKNSTKIDYNIQKEFKKEVTIDELTKDNSSSINNMSPEYIMSLFSDIGNLIGTLYTEKMQIIGVIPENSRRVVILKIKGEIRYDSEKEKNINNEFIYNTSCNHDTRYNLWNNI